MGRAWQVYSATLQPNRSAGCTEGLWRAVARGNSTHAESEASAVVRAWVQVNAVARAAGAPGFPFPEEKRKKCRGSALERQERALSCEFPTQVPQRASAPTLASEGQRQGRRFHSGGILPNHITKYRVLIRLWRLGRVTGATHREGAADSQHSARRSLIPRSQG